MTDIFDYLAKISAGLTEEQVRAKIAQTLEEYAWMNDGKGIIVTRPMGAELRKMGFTEGFTEAAPLPAGTPIGGRLGQV